MVSLFWCNLKNYSFWPRLIKIWPKFGHICPYHSSVSHSFSLNLFFNFFLKLFGLLELRNAEKMFLGLFWKIPVLTIFAKKKTVQNWPFCPKMPKNGGFFFFYCNPFIITNFLYKVAGVEKNTFSHFLEKFENDPLWPKLPQIWPKFGQKMELIGFLLKTFH